MAIAAGWYALGIIAAGGDWRWPGIWLDAVRGYLDADFAGNADKAVSVPGLVARLAGPPWLPLVAGAAVVLVSLPRLARAPLLEAGSAACLVGVAVSPHAWGYDAALVGPFLLWLASEHRPLDEPLRTRLIAAAYLLGPLWLFSRQTVVSAVAIVVIGLVLVWLVQTRRMASGVAPAPARAT